VGALRAALAGLDQMMGGILAGAVARAPWLARKLDVIGAFAGVSTRQGLG
jgi:hypothetical protein